MKDGTSAFYDENHSTEAGNGLVSIRRLQRCVKREATTRKTRNRDRADGSSSAQTLGTNSTLIFVSNTGLFRKSRDIFNLRSAERDLTDKRRT
jgi:hypothetical protein